MGKDALADLLGMTDEEMNDTTTNETETETEDADTGNETNEEQSAAAPSLGQLESLQKERDGLLKGMKEERKKRQEFQSRLDVLTGTVNAILEKRSNSAADVKGEDVKKKPAIVIETDDDGNDVLPVDKLEAVLSPYKQEIESLRQLITTQHHLTQTKSEQDADLQMILGEDESYPKAYNKYIKARTWANQRVIEWQKENGWSGPMTGELAMDHVFDNNLEAEFQKMFPNANLEATIGQSKRSFKNALKSYTETTSADEVPAKPKGKPQDNRFQKVLNKPSGLAGARNAKGGDLSVTERVGSLSSVDIMSLSDKEVAALQEALLAEEKSGGIKF